jgi:plasmid stabilization system protein ParE
MTRRVRLTTEAQADLDQIFTYIGRDTPRAAERYIRTLQERCQVYEESPFIGQAEPFIAQRLQQPPENVRSFLYRNHRC